MPDDAGGVGDALNGVGDALNGGRRACERAIGGCTLRRE